MSHPDKSPKPRDWDPVGGQVAAGDHREGEGQGLCKLHVLHFWEV